MSIKSFDFYQFLKDITNQSLAPLQDNARYDVILQGIASIFSKLYERVQEIKITNTLDITADLDYQNYLNTNDGDVKQNVILEYLSLYLNTDHFKDTVAVLMRLYEYRSNGNQINNLDQFIASWIIPSFKFFTMNAGDLHKSKGTKALLERLFEFYSEVNDDTQMFDGLIEQETEDARDRRFNLFTSYRISADEISLKKNYENISALSDIQITQYVELYKHRYVVANGFLFMSEKDRDDWWIIDILDAFYKIDENYFVVKRDDIIYLYSDDHDMYTENFEFDSPEWIERETNVEFVPQIINNRDPLGEYHYGNFYWIEKIPNDADTFADYLYNLKRWKVVGTTVELQMVRQGLGLGYEPLAFTANQSSYPRINAILSVDYLWLDFHDPEATSYEFDVEDVKMVYTFTYSYQFKKPTGLGGFEYPIEKMLAIARDGYDYDPETNGFYYNILSRLNNNNITHYQTLERVVSSLFEKELTRLIASNTIDARTAFDVFLIEQKTKWNDDYYSFEGYWNAGNETSSPPSMSPSHGDYWIVSNDGDIELNGLKRWRVGDVVVWNANFGYWEKNNSIKTLTNGQQVDFAIDHKIIALSKYQSDNSVWFYGDPPIADIPEMDTPYERSGGMFILQCSDIPLDIGSWSDIIWVDGNAIETFGDDPSLLFCYKEKNKSRYKVYSVKMNGFVRENDRMDLTRILRNYPLNTSILRVYKLEITDKHLIAYCYDTRNSSLKSMAVVLENSAYNLPLEFRNNEINVSYDADVRTRTRANQPWYRIWDEDEVEVENEEVEAMKNTLEVYAPINSYHDSLHALVDIGYSKQNYVPGSAVSPLPVFFPNLGENGTTKTQKEQVALKLQDSLFLRIDGDPDDVNCDCEDQRKLFFVYDFEPMTLFYDLETMTPDPNVYGYPTKVQVNRLGLVNDEYSGHEDVCRFESDWFYYNYDSGETFPVLVRHKIRVNLYSKFQQFVPFCANDYLRFNWSIHHYIEYYHELPNETIPYEWIVGLDEEIFMPVQVYNECNPVGIFYTTNLVDDGSTIGCPIALKSPWNVYNIEASKISLV